jgi:pyrimidine deaminase RibD-like protein
MSKPNPKRFERECMKLAIEQARLCVSEAEKISPKVGAVVAKAGEVLGAAFRGELAPGEHAEFTLLERKLQDVTLAGQRCLLPLSPALLEMIPRFHV